ncbi:D-alanyl-D-alanine carboxypeptidase/D-alanyl-D-alanine endopeptidase [Neogemmobacter tilapiae]|uniref:D-alanyl-D-alanine carboxypeptidase n=1 Tax=Neogemmobacter tilapiae TaxID=875041 RepID=A0A918WK49_9RHOB|nr:D-alanyl-D-alanine carboxypeptidase/D-alanyl-D-alanine-endopeptidase [Gemmobacter tilapiae]GHC53758.1 D-alanyl-D-alanine carboxypeptidase [Gemmobacter tilapiae]
MSESFHWTRRGALGLLLAGLGQAALAEAPPNSFPPRRRGDGGRERTPPPGDASGLIAKADLGGTVSYLVVDTATGMVLEGGGTETALPPASTAKAATAFYALERLGPDFRFVTKVLATGPLANGIVQGDLVLLGGGDPTLQTDQLGDLVARLGTLGLRGVTGRFLFDDSTLPRLERIDGGQPDQVGYNPALSGLNLNFNRVYFEWKREGDGYRVTMDGRGERFMPQVSLARMQVAQREAPLFTYDRSGAVEDWTVASAALGKGGSRWLPVRQPGLYAAEVFRELAAAQGIRLPAPEAGLAPADGKELDRVESEALPELLRDMLRFSTNLTAEVVGLRASGAAGLAGSAQAMNDWLKMYAGVDLALVDHSGLGGASRVTVGAMVALMQKARGADGAAKLLPGILRDFGMRDAKGKAIKGHPVRVPSKTGTLNFVSGLVGYVEPPSGRVLSFAIYAADTERRDALALEDREAPPGGAAWVKRARLLEARLVERWVGVYG